MEYKISKMIANKKRYIFHIIMAVFILIALTISIIGSFMIYQYEMTKTNFSDNQYAKSVEVLSYNMESNEVRKLNKNDIENIQEILDQSTISSKIIAEGQINFGIETEYGDVIFIKTFSDNFFIKDIIQNDCLITKKDYDTDNIVLNVPVIQVEYGGFKSDEIEKTEYNIQKLDKNSVLNRYFR